MKAVKACKRESKGMTKEERKQECLLALGRYLGDVESSSHPQCSLFLPTTLG